MGNGDLQLDISQDDSVGKIKDRGFDFILNLTGQISWPITACLRQNTLGIQHMIAACSQVSTFIHLSSVGVYGSGQWADETSVCNPETPYSALKLVSETLVLDGLPEHQRLVLRLSNVYGASQPKGLFAYLKRSALSDKFLEFNNNGSLTRFFLHVEDLSNGLIELLKKNTEIQTPVVNLVGRDQYSVLQLIALFEDKFKVAYRKQFEPVKPYDNMMSISDHVFRNLTDFEEQYKLDTYVDELIDHVD